MGIDTLLNKLLSKGFRNRFAQQIEDLLLMRPLWLLFFRIAHWLNRAVPFYRLSFKLFYNLFRIRLIQKLFLRRVTAQLNIVCNTTQACSVDNSLIAQTITDFYFRSFLIVRMISIAPEIMDNLFTIKAPYDYMAMLNQKKPLLFVHCHLPNTAIIQNVLLYKLGVQLTFIGQQYNRTLRRSFKPVTEEMNVMAFARETITAATLLRKGEPVGILSDGGRGADRREIEFFGQIKTLNVGFAKLALATSAEVIPVQALMSNDGTLIVQFFEPFTLDPDRTTDEKIRQLVDQFTRHMEHLWLTSPQSIMTPQVRRFGKLITA
jgi:lauroyl/myristoyl acyltransferase